MNERRTLDIRIYGESHAECIGVIAEGLPKDAVVNLNELKTFLARRAPGNNEWSTPRKEADLPNFLRGAGVDGDRLVLSGGLFDARINNTNVRSKDYENVARVPRPGHADFGSWVKYGEIRPGGGKWSGRMTAPLCIIGGIVKQLLEQDGIEIKANIHRIADVCDSKLEADSCVGTFPTVSEEAETRMREVIARAKENGDSVGGEISCIITGVRAGIGDALFDGVEAEIARMAFAIPAVKGIEFGSTKDYGSENNDDFIVKDGKVETATNNAGGVLGGITTGMPIEFKLKIKPTPSIAIEQRSVNLDNMKEVSLKVEGRHDPCILPRAVPVVEACAAIAVYNLIRGEEDEY